MKNIVKIVLVVLALFPVIVNAEITLTDDVLEQGVKKLYAELSDGASDEGDFTLDKVNKKLSITSEDESLSAYYKINDNNTITFTSVGRYYKGMSYDEYQAVNTQLVSGIVGYVPIAHMNNIKTEDSIMYFMLTMMQAGLADMDGNSSLKPTFIVVPDDQTVTTTDENVQVIKESEFGQYALELANKSFKDLVNKKVYKDSDQDLINSYSFGYINDLSKIPGLTQKEDELYILSELTINPNADFSKLDGISKRTPDTPDKDTSGTKDDSDSKDTSISDSTTEQTKSTGNEETNPKTGLKDNYLVLGISLIVGVIMLAMTRKKQIFRKI